MFFLVLLLVHVGDALRHFPPYLEKCHAKDPKVEDCYLKAMNSLKNHFDVGIPEFNLPPMNPLVIPQIYLNSPSGLKAAFKEMKIYQLNRTKVKYIGMDLSNIKLQLKLHFPMIRVETRYAIHGKILFLRLNGTGLAEANFTNVMVDAELKGERYKRANKEYIQFSNLRMKEGVDKPSFRFEGLFESNPGVNQRISELVGENFEDIMEEIRPSVYGAVEETVLGLLGPMFRKFPVNDLFPE